MDLPTYDELPPAPDGGRSAWGLFGADDSLGLMNLITPEKTRAAAGLVRHGLTFSLNAPLDFIDPPMWKRAEIAVDPIVSPWSMNEVINNFNPQASSQWDSLAHVAYAEDTFYNGVSAAEVLATGRNTISHWARRGIVTRGVLLDVQRLRRAQGREYSPGSDHTFSVDDLEAAREMAGVTFEPGDVLVLHTGFMAWYAGLSAPERLHISDRANMQSCGIEHTEEMARYLWNSRISAIASDCPAVEVIPSDQSPEGRPFGMLHSMIIGQFGMGIGELWLLDELAAHCAEDGAYEFLLTSAPLNNRRGVGSPANALAVK